MKLSVCAIVKNEEKRIQSFIRSAKEYADEILFVDNGSTDRTAEIIADNGCKAYHSDEKFDLARNEYLARATGDWILNLDIDERLEARFVDNLRDGLEHLDENVQGVLLPFFNYFGAGSWTQWNLPRILRNNHRQRLTSPMHASLSQSAIDSGGVLAFLYAPVHHYDALWNEDQSVKRQRNLSFLLEAIAKNPAQKGDYLNLANEYYALGQKKEAIELIKRECIQDQPANSRVYKRLANYLYDSKEYEESIAYAGLQIDRFSSRIKEDDPRAARYRMEIEACHVIQYKSYYALGQKEKALALCDENIRRFPFLPHNYMNRLPMEGRKDRKDYEMAAILNPELRKEEIHQPLRCDNLYKCGSSIILEED